MSMDGLEEILENLEGDEPVVEGAKVECSRSPDKDATMRIMNQSYDTRNGNKILKNTDIYFSPDNFGRCKGERQCLPNIESDIWRDCDHNNLTSGKPSVTMKSYMVCIYGSGLIYVKENGQIEAGNIQYGKHLSLAEIEGLTAYFFQKMDWGVEEDKENVEYIAMCMKLAGMDTRRSIEFFLLSCCMESCRGTELVQWNADDPGRGYIQVTKISDETYLKIAEEGNKWRTIAGKDAISWHSNPPDQEEIKATFSERENGLAWEASIGFWCFEKRGPHDSTNAYVVKYEMHEGNELEEGKEKDEYQYTPEGLYFVTQCYVNQGDLGDAGEEMRKGNINNYIIEADPEEEGAYKYSKLKEDGSTDESTDGSTDSGSNLDAPNGLVERARVYMKYYDKEEKIWNFSDEILENWENIPT